MAKGDGVSDWRERIVGIAAALPDAEASGKQHVTFRVRKKTFAYFLVDHHGDGRIALACKAAAGEQEELVAADPDRFYIPAYVGPRGWIALDLEATEIDWSEVEELLKQAYRLTAPKTLARQVP